MTGNIEVEVEVGHEGPPGSPYHTVTVRVRRRSSGRLSVQVYEEWGSNQGYHETHGSNEVYGRADDLDEALADAERQAQEAGVNRQYLAQALSKAANEAEDQLEENAPAEAE